MSDNLNSAWRRLKAQTPTFFKKLRNIGASLSAAGLACIAPTISPSVKMPPTLIELGTHAIVAGFVISIVSSFACQNPDDIKKEVDRNQPTKP